MSDSGSFEQPPVFHAVAFGETLAAFMRGDTPDCYTVTAIGAESNVAVGMAQLGCRTQWVSRLGDDRLGHFIQDCITGHGVATQIEWDNENSTGICIKEIGPDTRRVRYYRSESAARHLSVAHTLQLEAAEWVHVTGITPALSPSAAAAVAAILERRTGDTGRVSFDVNYRPALWPDAAAASCALVDLARLADVVFIGDDEAEMLLGSSETDDLARQLLVREDQKLVIKRGSGPATVATKTGYVSVPARAVAVVDLTGAGDAFAAGYLAGACWGWEDRDRLRLAHFLAARVVAVPSDLGPNLTREERAGLAATVRRGPQQ